MFDASDFFSGLWRPENLQDTSRGTVPHTAFRPSDVTVKQSLHITGNLSDGKKYGGVQKGCFSSLRTARHEAGSNPDITDNKPDCFGLCPRKYRMTAKRTFWTASVPDGKKLISHAVGKRPGDREIRREYRNASHRTAQPLSTTHPIRCFVIANAVKQSMRVHWIASYLAMTNYHFVPTGKYTLPSLTANVLTNKYSFPAYQENVSTTRFFVSCISGKRHDDPILRFLHIRKTSRRPEY
jgi:hypothetical protein